MGQLSPDCAQCGRWKINSDDCFDCMDELEDMIYGGAEWDTEFEEETVAQESEVLGD